MAAAVRCEPLQYRVVDDATGAIVTEGDALRPITGELQAYVLGQWQLLCADAFSGSVAENCLKFKLYNWSTSSVGSVPHCVEWKSCSGTRG